MKLQELELKNLEDMASLFFQKSEGEWKSQRRYYTLKQEKAPQEVVSNLKIRFLPSGCGRIKKFRTNARIDRRVKRRK